MRFGRDAVGAPLRSNQTSHEIISSELDPDEDIFWVDAPVSLLSHAKAAIPKALFGIPFLAFAIFWISMARSMTRDATGIADGFFSNLFPLFGIPFVLIGLAMVLSPLWNMFKARKTTYALTNKRLIIHERFPRQALKSWLLNDIRKLVRLGMAQGPGDIYFAEETKRTSKGGTTTIKIGFIGIAEPKLVEQKIRGQMKQG